MTINNLTLLANKYVSDKGTEYASKHGFTEIYENYFLDLKEKEINILEIGVNDGASLRMWYEYFPKAFIVGLDIEDKSHFNNDRITCKILDQSSKQQLNNFSDFCNVNNLKFDLIIDDGSHHISDQQITLASFFKILNSGGIYILEDLHTSLCDPHTIVYYRPMENSHTKHNTTLTFLKNKPLKSIFLTPSENELLNKDVASIEIYERSNPLVPDDYKNMSITSIIKKI